MNDFAARVTTAAGERRGDGGVVQDTGLTATRSRMQPPRARQPASAQPSTRRRPRSATSQSSARSIDDVLAANPEQVETYRGGKEGVLGFLVGQVMKETQGKADPKVVNRLLREKLRA